jgi:transcriptional regulator with XRE-family HTH domain
VKDDKTNLVFANIIRQFVELRHAQGLSHESLARLTGVTRPAISHIESGKRKPSLLVSLKLAAALNLSLSDLVKHAETQQQIHIIPE